MSFATFPTRAERLGYAAALTLTLLRALLAIPLLIAAVERTSGRVIGILLAVGFVSDVYDGVVARRYGVATAGLRRLDSAVDTLFYIAAGICVWRLHPAAISDYRWLVALVIGSLVVNHTYEFAKYGREASYHAWSAKAWGAALFIALVYLFVANDASLIPYALIVGLLSHAEVLAIDIVLPVWSHDVRSIYHAVVLRRSLTPDSRGNSS